MQFRKLEFKTKSEFASLSTVRKLIKIAKNKNLSQGHPANKHQGKQNKTPELPLGKFLCMRSQNRST
jgi:hypothetical protein